MGLNLNSLSLSLGGGGPISVVVANITQTTAPTFDRATGVIGLAINRTAVGTYTDNNGGSAAVTDGIFRISGVDKGTATAYTPLGADDALTLIYRTEVTVTGGTDPGVYYSEYTIGTVREPTITLDDETLTLDLPRVGEVFSDNVTGGIWSSPDGTVSVAQAYEVNSVTVASNYTFLSGDVGDPARYTETPSVGAFTGTAEFVEANVDYQLATISLNPTSLSVAEGATAGTKLADITATGSNPVLSLSGADAAKVQIVGTELQVASGGAGTTGTFTGITVTNTSDGTGNTASADFTMTVAAVPVLSALSITGEDIDITADIACRLYVRRNATAGNPTAATVISDGGFETTGRTFDLVAGSNSITIDFDAGNDGLQQIAFAARVEPSGAPSNVLYDDITVDTIAPTISTSDPADNSTDHPVGDSITITFDDTIAFGASGTITLRDVTGATDAETFDVASDVGAADGQVSISGSTLTINPTGNLANSNDYAIRFTAGAIEDEAGNAMAAVTDDTTLNFTTAGGATLDYTLFTGSGNNGLREDFTAGRYTAAQHDGGLNITAIAYYNGTDWTASDCLVGLFDSAAASTYLVCRMGDANIRDATLIGTTDASAPGSAGWYIVTARTDSSSDEIGYRRNAEAEVVNTGMTLNSTTVESYDRITLGYMGDSSPSQYATNANIAAVLITTGDPAAMHSALWNSGSFSDPAAYDFGADAGLTLLDLIIPARNGSATFDPTDANLDADTGGLGAWVEVGSMAWTNQGVPW